MKSSFEPPLNQSFVLRYDTSHSEVLPETPDNTGMTGEAMFTEGPEQMNVNGIGSVNRTSSIPQVQPAVRSTSTTPSNAISSPTDEVEISSAGKMLENMNRTSSIREERIAQIKAAIANGTYETPEKLEAALEKMFSAHGLNGGD